MVVALLVDCLVVATAGLQTSTIPVLVVVEVVPDTLGVPVVVQPQAPTLQLVVVEVEARAIQSLAQQVLRIRPEVAPLPGTRVMLVEMVPLMAVLVAQPSMPVQPVITDLQLLRTALDHW